MKKYYFILLASLLLSGCNGSDSREFVEFEPPPYLTTMTMTTTIPVDTYSEYMETYTPTSEETTNSNMFYYQGGAAVNGVSADTMATFPSMSQVSGVTADTPMSVTTPPPETGSWSVSESTETVSADMQDGEGLPETVTATAEIPEAVPADTAGTGIAGGSLPSVNTVPTDTFAAQSAVPSQPVNTVPTDTFAAQSAVPPQSVNTVSAVTAVSPAWTVPPVSADTAFSNDITGYTGTVPTAAPDTMYKNTSTSNGGTDNADQHT